MKAFNAAMVAGVDPKPQVIDVGEGPFLHTTMERSIGETATPSAGSTRPGT